MLDQKGNTTTWQDNHSGPRGHQLMTKEIADTIPPLYANDGAGRPRRRPRPSQAIQSLQRLALVHHRVGPRDRTVLRPRRGFEVELGYFDLTELAEVTVFGGVPAVERDLYWEPQTLGEIRRQSR